MAGENNLLNSISSFNTPTAEPLMIPEVAPIKVSNPVEQIAAAKKASLTGITAAKQTTVAANPKTPTVDYSTEDLMRQQAAVWENTEEGRNSFMADRGRMSQADLIKKYGPNTPELLIKANQASDRLLMLGQVDRTINETLADSALQAIGGAGRTVEGLAAAGRIVTDSLGLRDTAADFIPKMIEEGGRFIADKAKENYSDNYNTIQDLAGLDMSVRAQESKRLADEAVASGEQGSLEAGLRRLGRDAASGIESFIDHPATFGGALAENAASLAFSAGGGAIAGRAAVTQSLKARGVADDVIERFLATDKGQEAIRAASVAAQPALSGVLEGSGAAAEANAEFDKLTPEQIKSAPDYSNLIKEGYSESEATDIIRQRVVREAAATQLIAGVGTGFLSRGFDAAPMSGGFRSLVPNAVGESVEEGIQGATGGLGLNTAMQRNVDPETDVLAGVGEQIGQGMAVGAGMVGALQGPGAVVGSAVSGAQAAGEAASKAAGAVGSALDRRAQAQVDADSATSDEALVAQQMDAEVALDEAVAEVEAQAPAEAVEPVEGETPAEAPVESPVETSEKKAIRVMQDAYRITPEALPERVKALVQDENGEVPVDRTTVIRKLNNKFAEAQTDEEKLHIAAALTEQFNQLSMIRDEETVAAVTALPDDSKVKAAHNQITSFIAGFAGSEATKPIREFIEQNVQSINNVIDNITDDTEDAEVAETLTSIATVHEQAPDQADPEKLSQVLDMARKRKISLPDNVVQSIESTIDISRVAKLHGETYESSPIIDAKTKTRQDFRSSDVRQQIFTQGYKADASSTGSAPESRKKAVIDHVRDIRTAMRSGQKSLAQEMFTDLTNFALTQANKLKAIDASSKDGKQHAYEFYDPDTAKWYSSADRQDLVDKYGAPKYGLTKQSNDPKRVRNSYNNYKQIFADATAVTAIQQTLAAEFPELGEALKFEPASISVARNEGIFELKQLGELGEMVLKNRQTRAPKMAPVNNEVITDAQPTIQAPIATPTPAASLGADQPTASVDEVAESEETPALEVKNKRDNKEHFKDSVEDNFYEYYNNDENSSSLLSDKPKPVETVMEWMGEADPSSGQGLVKDKLLKGVAPLVQKANQRLSEQWKVAQDKTTTSNRKDGRKITYTSEQKRQWRNLRHTIFASKDDKGNYKLNQQVAETASLAALAVISNISPKYRVDTDSMMEKFGFDNWEGRDNKNINDFLKKNEPLFQVRDNITRLTMQMLGLKYNQDVMESSARGAIDTLITEILHLMKEDGTINHEVMKVKINGKVRDLPGVQLGSKFSEAEKKLLNKHSDLITQTVLPEGEKKFFIGEPPTDQQLRSNVKGTQNKLSRKQRLAVRHSSNIKHYLNDDFFYIVDELGVEAMAKIRGYIELTDEMRSTYNVNHLASIEGKNQTIMSEIEEVMELRERMQGMDVDTAIYFPHEVTKVGRIQAVGPASGQSNKFARAGVRSTWATLNLKGNPAHQEGFWRTVLQMSGTKINGKKIERLSTAQIMGQNAEGITAAEEAIVAKYGPVIQELEKMLFVGSEKPNMDVITEGLQNTEPVVLESLLAVAKYNRAREEDTLEEFRHSVPLEADGVTNGPAAVLVKFTTGDFTTQEIEQYERLGYFFKPIRDEEGNLIPRTLDTQSVPMDTYEVAKSVAEGFIEDRQQEMEEDKNKKAIRDAVNRFLSVFNPKGVTIEEDRVSEAAETILRWKLDRNASKNPLTKTTYGAGKMGTARGITSEALDNFYKALTEYKQNPGDFTLNEGIGYPKGHSVSNDLKLLISEYYRTNKEGKVADSSASSDGKLLGAKDISQLTLDPEAFESLAHNINTVYVDPLYKAVEVTMGSAFQNMQVVIKAASVQSAVLMALHKRMMAEFGANEVPSPAFQKAWMERFKRLGAYIETPDQVFSIGGAQDRFIYNESVDGKERDTKDVSRSTKNEMSSGFRGQVPGPAGVGAAAYINIGTGDGYMMTTALSALPESVPGLDRVLQIYDGMEMPADAFKELGVHMNEAASAAWQTDTMKGVLDSFQNFMREFNTMLVMTPEGTLDRQLMVDIYNEIVPEHEKISSFQTGIQNAIAVEISAINDDLKEIAADTAARAKVRGKFMSWVDQMAGAGSPYQSGSKLAGETHAEIAATLNEEINKLKAEDKEKEDYRLKRNVALSAAMRSQGDALSEAAYPGVVSLSTDGLDSLVRYMDGQSRDLFETFLKPHLNNQLEIFYGPREVLEKYRSASYEPNTLVGVSPIPVNGGQYDPVNNVIYIAEPTDAAHLGEAVIHELTHSVLAHKIYQYFKDSSAMPKEHREAMERIVALTEDFLLLNFKNDNKEVQERISALRLKMDTAGVNAVTVNEVVAEILTNPSLRKVSQQQKVSNPLVKITRDIIKAIKALFPNFGRKTVNESYFDNMLFNVHIMVNTPITPVPYGPGSLDGPGSSLQMSRSSGVPASSGSRAARTAQLVQQSVSKIFNNMGVGNNPSLFAAGANTLQSKSLISLMDMQDAGFTFNMAEETAFRQVLDLFTGDARINGAVLARSQEVYEHVMGQLSYADFMPAGAIPGGQEEADARAKYDALRGVNTRAGQYGLPVFLALASSNQEFAAILDKISLPLNERAKFGAGSTVDEWLSQNTQAALNELTRLVVGEDRGTTAGKAAQNLAERLAQMEAQKNSAIEDIYQNTIQLMDDKGSAFLDRNSTEYVEKIRKMRKSIKNPVLDLPVKMAQNALSMFSKKEGQKTAEEFTKMTNSLSVAWTPVIELMAEFRGRTVDNAKIYDMINKVRYTVSTIREVFREKYPTLIAEKFKRKLNKAEWKALQVGMAQLDTAVLLGSGRSLQDIAKLYRSKAGRAAEISALSQGLSPAQLDMADRLAAFMAHRTTQNGNVSGLRVNAHAIMMMTGKTSQTAQIDELVTLLAIDKLNKDTRKIMVDLFTGESEGMNFALAQMDYFRRREQLKTNNNPEVMMNQWKGYIPNESGVGVDVVIAEKDSRTHLRLAYMGYERIEDYDTSPSDPYHKKLAVYRSTVAGKNPYTQGAAQTVQNSQGGVDIRTGRDVSGLTSGLITGAEARSINVNRAGNLRPIFDKSGQVVAYERLLSPKALDRKNLNNNFGEMIGAMAGRQIEENQARKFNRELVKLVKERYREDMLKGQADQYIDLAKSKDPIHKDTWKNAIPREMKDDLRDAFGSESFPVRKDMIPMVMGFRNPGVSDFWTGVSRLPVEVQDGIRTFVTRIFGRKAYAYMKNAETLITSAVSEAKVIIVVKSIIVPIINIASNMAQLVSRGVPLRFIMTEGMNKFHEINSYLQSREKGMRIQAELRATNDPILKNKLKAQLDSIEQTNRRLSIYPLIERGEFQTISEGLNEVNVSLREGKYAEWVEQQVEKLPDGVKTFGRYAVVSKATSLYKGLNRSVQYGDFLAKAIMYDDLTNRRKYNQAEALGKITQEFVNYNVPSGRVRTFLEQFGLTWFWTYKIRSLKPAIEAIQENPVRALMMNTTIGQTSFIGTAVEDNLLSVIAQGKLDNTMGLDMLFRAPELLPWSNITG